MANNKKHSRLTKESKRQKKNLVRERVSNNPPQKIQDIPMLFSGVMLPVIQAIMMSLYIAKDFDLIPSESPLRTIWYSFVKRVIEENGRKVADPAGTFYNAGSDIIYKTDLYYRDFNIETSSILYKINDEKGFGNTMICLEKESYFGVLRNFGKLCGVTIYSGGGNPSLSGAEYLYHTLPKKDGLEILTITDFDPSGIDIAYTFKKQFNHYAKRLRKSVTFKQVGVDPLYYTPQEIALAKYKCSSTNRSRWNWDSLKKIREDVGIDKEEGFEVESMPADPTDVFHLIFPDFNLNNWRGHARMRLIVLKNLIELNGIESYLLNWMDTCFHIERDTEEIVYSKYGIDESDELGKDILYKIEEIKEVSHSSVSIEKDFIKSNLKRFKEEYIEYNSTNEEYIHDFQQNLIDAVSEDDDVLDPVDIEIPQEIPDSLEINEEKKERVERLKRRLHEVLDELDHIQHEFEQGGEVEKESPVLKKVYCSTCGRQSGWSITFGKEDFIKTYGEDYSHKEDNRSYYTINKEKTKDFFIDQCESCRN